MPQNSFDSSTVVNLCLLFLDGIVPVYTKDVSLRKKSTSLLVCFHKPMYSFVCATPNLPYFHSVLYPCQGIKYPSAVDINIHPGSSISSQFWFSLLSVIRPQRSPLVWGKPVHSGCEDTMRGDLWFGMPVLESTNICKSQQVAPF